MLVPVLYLVASLQEYGEHLGSSLRLIDARTRHEVLKFELNIVE